MGGASKNLSNDSRPNAKRLETAPPGLGNDSDNLSTAAARAAELVNGSHLASTLSTVQTVQGLRLLPNLPQASRAAPRPPISANRPALSSPGSSTLPSAKAEMTPLPADLRLRAKAQGPPAPSAVPLKIDSLPTPSEQQARQQVQQQQERQEQQWQQEQQQRLQEQKQQMQQEQRLQQQQEQKQQQQQQQPQRTQDLSRPVIAPSKSSPATTTPATHPVGGAAGSTTGPPPVLPLQPTKKVQIQAQEKPTKVAAATGAAATGNGGGVAAAAAALEKPKEKRISTMTEVQIMEKLRQVVSDDDPKLLYSKIKKVGQG